MAKKEPDLTRVGECLWRHQSLKYYAIVRVGGKQIKRSLKTKDLGLAKRKLRKFREKVERVGGLGKSMRFGELADLWLASVKARQAPNTYRTTKGIVGELKRHFDVKEAGSITVRDVDEWKSKRTSVLTRHGRTISPRRYNYELETLRQISRYGIEVIHCMMDDPTLGQKRQKHTPTKRLAPTKVEFQAIVEALRAEPKAHVPGGASDLVELLAYTGVRVGSVPFMTWDCIDWSRKQMKLFNTKLRRWYHLPLFPALKDFLKTLRQRTPNALATSRLIAINDAKKALGHACERAGTPRYTHHCLRHFLATNAVEEGVDFKVIAGWLDHSDGGFLVAKTYGHLRAEHSAEMAKRMVFKAITA